MYKTDMLKIFENCLLHIKITIDKRKNLSNKLPTRYSFLSNGDACKDDSSTTFT